MEIAKALRLDGFTDHPALRPPVVRLFPGEVAVVGFAGGGGTCEGIKWATGQSPDVALNHNWEALAMHRRNHPKTRHIKTDIFETEPEVASEGKPIGLAWFSPDCTEFSKAKGGKPFRDPRKSRRTRGLAWVVVKYARSTVRPRVMFVENVEEFKFWGAIKNDGRPNKKKIGRNCRRWESAIRAAGYTIESRELRAMNYGSRTIRKRLFYIMRCDGQPIVWPKVTHGPQAEAPLPKWDPIPARSAKHRTAAECIDFSIPVPSIFMTRAEAKEWAREHKCGIPQRPLANNTMRRIARGLFKFVIENPEPFIVNNMTNNVPRGLSEPVATILSGGHKLFVNPYLVPVVHKGDDRVFSLDDPMRTVVASDREFALVAPILAGVGGRKGQSPETSLDRPYHTTTAKGDTALVAAFLAKHNGGHEATGQRLQVPADTVMTVDQKALVTSSLVKLYGSCQHGAPVTDPMPGVTAQGNHIAEVRAFLVKFYGSKKGGNQLSFPLDTVTTVDRFGLVIVTIAGQPYVIVDIGMRMLTPRELYRAHCFLDSYVIDEGLADASWFDKSIKPGTLDYTVKFTKRTQTRLCGNSVPPHFSAALVAANLSEPLEAIA